jgi:type IV pilus assembly protein PilX
MNTQLHKSRARQRGMVLVSSLLLLLVITILALAMFRSTGLSEKISGNMRETERALHAAEVAQQYAEWWLSSGTNASLSPVTCNTTGNADLVATQVQICAITSALDNPVTLPWTSGGSRVGFTYYPNSTTATTMSFVATNGSYSNTYSQPPAFYIQYMGLGADGGGTVFKIDSLGYGGNQLSVAVVESTYEIGSGVKNLGIIPTQ